MGAGSSVERVPIPEFIDEKDAFLCYLVDTVSSGSIGSAPPGQTLWNTPLTIWMSSSGTGYESVLGVPVKRSGYVNSELKGVIDRLYPYLIARFDTLCHERHVAIYRSTATASDIAPVAREYMQTLQSMPGVEYHPFRYLRFSVHYTSIDLLVLLGFQTDPEDIYNGVVLSVVQWSALIQRGINLCKKPELLLKLVQDAWIYRQAVFLLPGNLTDGTIREYLIQGVLPHEAGANIQGTSSSRSQALARSHECLSISSEVLLSAIDRLNHLKERTESDRRAIEQEITSLQVLHKRYGGRAEEIAKKNISHTNLVIILYLITRVIEDIQALLNKKQQQHVFHELSLHPPQGIFPGGSEVRQASQRFHTSVSTVPTNVSLQDTLRTIEQASSIDEVIPELYRIGIVTFSTKEDILQIIALRLAEIIQQVQQAAHIEDLIPIAQKFMIQIHQDPKGDIIQEISEWSRRVTDQLAWSTLLQITNALNITSIPTTLEGIKTYVREYESQL